MLRSIATSGVLALALAVVVLQVRAAAGAADSDELADPTRPPAFTPDINRPVDEEGQAIVLSSIVISGNKKFAIVNGERIEVGDFIGGVEVLDITPSGLRLDSKEGGAKLRFSPFSVKRRAGSHDEEEPGQEPRAEEDSAPDPNTPLRDEDEGENLEEGDAG